MTVPPVEIMTFSSQQTMVAAAACYFPSSLLFISITINSLLLLLPQWNMPRKFVLFQIRYFANGILNG